MSKFCHFLTALYKTSLLAETLLILFYMRITAVITECKGPQTFFSDFYVYIQVQRQKHLNKYMSSV